MKPELTQSKEVVTIILEDIYSKFGKDVYLDFLEGVLDDMIEIFKK